ncbi:MAG: hypothetical protein RLZZ244_219 [Verrucomicrobiota bacterium]
MLEITKGKVARPQRVVLYANEGVGKTTFASKFPEPLFIDTEKGSHHLDVARIQVANWGQVLEAVKLAKASASKFKTLVLDTADVASDFLAQHLCKEQGVDGIEQLDGGYGKGYARLADEWSEFLHGPLIEALSAGLHVALLVHAQAQKFTEPGKESSYDRFELLQAKKVAVQTKGWADELWFANWRTTIVEEKGKATIAVGGKERILHTAHAPSHDAKSRAGLAEKVPMTWEAVRQVFEIAPSTKPDPKSEPGNEIPMGNPPTGAHPLDAIFAGHDEAKINAFLEVRGQIKPGQSYRSASADYVARVLANPPAFLAAVLK